jgi:hypothetical protein
MSISEARASTSHTTIYLICPDQNITSHDAALNPVFLSPDPFPEVIPNPVLSGPKALKLSVYEALWLD